MKVIKTDNKYILLQEVVDDEVKLQMGFPIGGLTFKIENGNILFYDADDYCFNKLIWSANMPIEIDGVEVDESGIAEALKGIFASNTEEIEALEEQVAANTTAIQGKADKSDTYTKTQTDNKFATKLSGIDNIEVVNELPSNTDSRTLYLIPSQS